MTLPVEFLSYSIPKEVVRWTEIEAKVMASEKLREKYLNHEFGIVNNEELEVTDIKQTEKEKSCARFVKPIVFYCCPINSIKYKNIPLDHCVFSGRVLFCKSKPLQKRNSW